MARRDHARIGTDMPDEPTIRQLNYEEQWLYDHALYLRPELSRCGVAPYRPAVWADLAANATERLVRKWAAGLARHRHIIIDERYSEVLLRTFVRHDGLLGQPNVVAAMVADFQVISSPLIRIAFLAELRRIWDLPDLPDGERGGWQLAMGHYPHRKDPSDRDQTWPGFLDAASLARLTKAIGHGLSQPMTEAIQEGSVPPFTEGSPGGIPKPFPQTPYAGAIAESAVSVSERRLRAPSAAAVTGTPPGPPPRGGSHPHTQALLDEHHAALGPQPTRTTDAIRRHITDALAANIDPDAIREALDRWRRKPGGAKPGLLPMLIGDVIRDRHAASNGRPADGPASRAAATLAMADQLDALANGAHR